MAIGVGDTVLFFILMIRRPKRSTLITYTTLVGSIVIVAIPDAFAV